MVTTPGFADAVALAQDYPRLDLGVHLALTGVRPALPPARIATLVSSAGRFPTLNAWLFRALTGRLNPDELRAELRAQVERALATGLRFTHLDGHHHIHLFAPVAAIARDLAREYAIPVVRRIADTTGSQSSFPNAAKRWLLARAGRSAATSGVEQWQTASFRGLPFPSTRRDWHCMLRTLPEGVTEFMCHPGLNDPAVAPLDPLVALRERELRWLCHPWLAALLVEARVSITSFAEQLALARERHDHR